jgi:hypothetical protein
LGGEAALARAEALVAEAQAMLAPYGARAGRLNAAAAALIGRRS